MWTYTSTPTILKLNGFNCRHTQFPSVCKTALPSLYTNTRIDLAKGLPNFGWKYKAPGQVYVTLSSRCTMWNNIDISHLDALAYMTDWNVIWSIRGWPTSLSQILTFLLIVLILTYTHIFHIILISIITLFIFLIIFI